MKIVKKTIQRRKEIENKGEKEENWDGKMDNRGKERDEQKGESEEERREK